MTRFLLTLLLLALTVTVWAESDTPPVKPLENEQKTEPVEPPLLEAEVFDALTAVPIRDFRFLPGTPFRGYLEDRTQQVAVWQPHLIKAGKDGEFEWSRKRTYREFRLRIEADGYQPAETDWFKRDEISTTKKIRIDLKPDPGIEGKLLTPDGKAAADATIGIAMPNRGVRLKDGKIEGADQEPPEKLSDRWRRPQIVRTNERGEFRLPTETSPAVMVVFVHESGYLQLPATELRGPEILKLQGWGSIEGQVLWKDKIGAGETISMIIHRELIYPEMVYRSERAVSDENGRFSFQKLPPGHAQLSRHLKENESDGGKFDYMFPVMHVDIQPGEPTKVTFGGHGKTIKGQLTGYDSYKGLTVSLAPNAPPVSGPIDSANSMWAGFSALRKSQIGALFFRDPVEVNEDGTFKIENVIPENYQIFVRSADRPVYKVHRVWVQSNAADEDQSVEIQMSRQRLTTP